MRGSGPAVSPPPGFPSACLRESRGFVFACRSLPSALNPLAIALGFFLSVCGIVVAALGGCQCATPSKRIVLVWWTARFSQVSGFAGCLAPGPLTKKVQIYNADAAGFSLPPPRKLTAFALDRREART